MADREKFPQELSASPLHTLQPFSDSDPDKRAMAGEYSRELSVKVFAGQCRLIELAFRQGGPPG